jgi:cation diffusion facilitator family transporter
MDKVRAGYREGIIAIIVNTGLFGIKLWAGIVSGSIALIADAWHTISDSLSSFIVIIGSRLASEKPDKDHPFGHGRWEPITAIFIGFFLAVIAYNFIRDSIDRFIAGQTADFGLIAIVVTAISLLVKAWLAQYAFSVARKSGNSAVRADGWHHQSDALTSGVILAAIFFADRFWWIDSILGGLVSLLLLYAVFEIMKEAVNKLLGERPDPELIRQVESIIENSYHEDVMPHHYHLHNYIDHKELTFHIKVDDNMDVHNGHEIATEIENRIFRELNITATIHVEPKNHKHKTRG